MDIKVGEYVRINNDFRLIALGIGEVIRINQDTIYVKNNFELPFAFKIGNVTKHSKNIIDLIEVGDYVNGEKVIEVHPDLGYVFVDKETELGTKTFCDYQIETILTHEQMEENQYVVKRNMETN